MNTSGSQNTDTPLDRPFGYWLKAVDRLMAAEFAAAFAGEHASRREWRLLNVVDGAVPARRPLTARRLRRLVERGWVVADGDSWTLTDDGRAAKDRLGGIVDGIRAKVTDAVSPDDLATTISTLEQIARAFGWDEQTPLPRGRGREHGFGPEHEYAPDAEPGCGRGGHPHGERGRHGRGHGRHHGEHPAARAARKAYERGFDAGFSRGRDA